MSNAWDAYVAKYDKVPESSDKLMNFSKTTAKPLSFKEAKDLFNSRSDKGKASPVINAQKPPEKAAPKQKEEKQVVANEEADEKAEVNPLFAALNKGADVTKALNKVTPDMKTKNRPESERTGKVVVEEKPKAQPKAQAKAQDNKAKKEPSLSKKGFRWCAENYTEGVQSFDEADTKSEIYIATCKGGGFLVPNKVKGVTIDSCSKISVEVNEVVSTVELVNCQNVTVYIKKTAPSIHIDKCQQPRLIIFEEALNKNPNIITSMVQDLNIELPPENEQADAVEIAIPYQFMTSIDPKTKKAVTTPVEHLG